MPNLPPLEYFNDYFSGIIRNDPPYNVLDQEFDLKRGYQMV